MFKVECPGCKAPYQVDERRIPSSGLKMRCPKCGTSFKVDPPSDGRRTGPSPVLGGALGLGESAAPPVVAPPAPAQGTMLGVAPARPAAMKGTMLGVAPAAAHRPAAPIAPAAAPPAAPAPAAPTAAAPAPNRPPVPGRPPVPRAGASTAANADLPAVPARATAGAGAGNELDLPSVSGPKPAVPARAPAPAAPATAPQALDFDLPALSPRGEAVPPRTAPLAAAAPAAGGLELDLPSLSGGAAAPDVAGLPATAPQRGGIDLPSISRPNMAAVKPQAAPAVPRRGSPGGLDLELPSPRTASGAMAAQSASDLPSLLEMDLPLAAGSGASEIELDLPSPGGAPAPAATRPGFGGDLPSLAGDLPSPAAAGLPSLGGNLPTRASGAGLPAVGGNLPSRVSAAGLPAVGGSLPSPTGVSPSLPPALSAAFGTPPAVQSPPSAGLRAPSMRQTAVGGFGQAGGFGEIELPPSESLPPPQFSGGFGEVDLSGGLAGPPSASPGRAPPELESDPFGEAPLPGPMSARAGQVSAATAPAMSAAAAPAQSAERAFAATEAAISRQTGGGGTDFGEVNLDSGSGPVAEMDLESVGQVPTSMRAAAGRVSSVPRSGMPSQDDMEFGAVPQEATGAPGTSKARVSAPAPKSGVPKPKSRLGLQILAGTFVVGLGGAALALVPSVGPFGAFFVMDHVKAGEYHALVLSTAKTADAALAQDTYPDAKRALSSVTSAQLNARRAKGLSALAAYIGFVSELRFGADPATHARAQVLLDELKEETDVDMLQLARAAQAASEGQIAKSRQLLQGAESKGKTVESAVLRGELELRAKEPQAALSAWEASKRFGDTPRAVFGAARAKLAMGDDKGALALAESVLEKHPKHIGARALVARLSSKAREGEGRAVQLVEGIIADAKSASADELVQAYTLLGGVHLNRSRISAAEAAFGEALKINPKSARALVGLGDALYRAARYSEAQARFEAASAADPDDMMAKVGVAKSKLSLERLQEASALLKKLRETAPTSPVVGYWFGRVQEALGARDQALQAYREVLKASPSDPASADVYIALALLQNQQGRAEDAQKTLDSAKTLMPNVPGVWRALGDVAQSQGHYKEALAHFQRALSLDADDLGSKFRIGGALRRDGQFEEATKTFDAVAAIDKDYPGLALERGLLYEASGHSEEALKQYEDALSKAPTDPDLMLRVGCGKVAANRADQAEELLRKVLAQRPSSAETQHCLGRALLVQGTRLSDALRFLERAVELDPNRAEYYLYVGWAANEAGNVQKAERALAEALKLDQGLADAYWQRGVLRQRQGAVRDAITDLTRALQLRPSRNEAHAALADAYYDSGREADALREWQPAIAAQPDNPVWRFRYGRLLVANHQNDAAVEQLTKALALVASVEPPPRWAWEAHHALALALGTNPEAVKHWELFLRLGPRDSPYRKDAKAYLQRAGHPWTGD